MQHYRVRWLGCSPDSDSWKPRATFLTDIPDIVSGNDRDVNETASAEQLAVLEDLPIANEPLHVSQNPGDKPHSVEPANKFVGSIQSFIDQPRLLESANVPANTP